MGKPCGVMAILVRKDMAQTKINTTSITKELIEITAVRIRAKKASNIVAKANRRSLKKNAIRYELRR